MSWFFFAIVGQILNGVAFTIDKILLKTAFTRSATYAGIVGLLSAVIIFAFPFVTHWPHGWTAVEAFVSGVMFVFALWAFFGAMARGEATRVVPIIGSFIPMITLIGSYLFLAERLTMRDLAGFFLLIIATILLSGGGKGRLSRRAFLLAAISGFLFAVSSVTVKLVYMDVGFLSGFITTRAMVVITAALLLFFDRQAGREALMVLHIVRHKPNGKEKHPGKFAALLALFGQTVGAVGFILVQRAISLGSVSIINSLQAVQYAFLVLVAFVLHKRTPQLLGENLTRRVLIIKSIALGLTAIGLALII